MHFHLAPATPINWHRRSNVETACRSATNGHGLLSSAKQMLSCGIPCREHIYGTTVGLIAVIQMSAFECPNWNTENGQLMRVYDDWYWFLMRWHGYDCWYWCARRKRENDQVIQTVFLFACSHAWITSLMIAGFIRKMPRNMLTFFLNHSCIMNRMTMANLLFPNGRVFCKPWLCQ